MRPWSDSAKAIVFYGFNVVLLALIMTKHLKDVIPHAAATQVGHNSEAFLLALVLGLTIQYLRPAAERAGRGWLVMGGLAVVLVVIGVVLVQLKPDISSTISTLNEAFIGAGVIVAYLQLPRPLPAAPYLAGALFVAIVAFNRTDLVTTQAESLVFIMLAPISLDVADPTLADRRAEDRPTARIVWCLLLFLIPMLFFVLDRVTLTGLVQEIARYGRRPTEAFIALLLLHGYFSYLLGNAWRRSPATPVATSTSRG